MIYIRPLRRTRRFSRWRSFNALSEFLIFIVFDSSVEPPASF
jgi:hypothetical protein